MRRFEKLFKREQILILDSRALKHNTSRVIEEVVNFLGLPEYRHQGGWPPYLVGAYETQMPAAIRCLLREFYRPHNEKLYKLLDHDFDWQ